MFKFPVSFPLGAHCLQVLIVSMPFFIGKLFVLRLMDALLCIEIVVYKIYTSTKGNTIVVGVFVFY